MCIHVDWMNIYDLTCVLMYLFHIEREEKYQNVVHQNDVWHGGKNVAKKVNTVSISSICNGPNYIVSYRYFALVVLGNSCLTHSASLPNKSMAHWCAL